MDSEIRKQRELSIQNLREHVANLPYKPYTKEVKLTEDEEEKLLERKRKMAEKVEKYAQQVKSLYWPKVSERKKLELSPERMFYRKSASSKKISHDPILSSDLGALKSPAPPRSNLGEKPFKRTKAATKATSPMNNDPTPTHLKSIDYLKDQREKRE
mmetsp:Transcript_4589/g.3303  ORF Transcript_4589/g.3303 Transcript_4589/m.3303 type:complete len:157 (+) Transcript_4589:901-1371(+)